MKSKEGQEEIITTSRYEVEMKDLYMSSKVSNFSHSKEIDLKWKGTAWSVPVGQLNFPKEDPVHLFELLAYSFVQAADPSQKDKLVLYKQETAALYNEGATHCPVGDVKIMVFESVN